MGAEFLFIRHAESVANLHPEIVGGRRNNMELTEKGLLQAKNLGTFLIKQGYFPDRIFSSPAVRAHQTAMTVFGGKQILFDDRLQEMSQGDAEGKLRTDIYTPEVLDRIRILGKDFRLGDEAESINDVGRRMLGFINEHSHNEGRKIAVVSHGIAIKSMLACAKGYSQEWVHKTSLPNTSMTSLVIDRDTISVAAIGEQV